MTRPQWITLGVVLAGLLYVGALALLAHPEDLDVTGFRLLFVAIVTGLAALTLLERWLHAKATAAEPAEVREAHRKLTVGALSLVVVLGSLAIVLAPGFVAEPPMAKEAFADRVVEDLRTKLANVPANRRSALVLEVTERAYFEEHYADLLRRVPEGELDSYLLPAQTRCLQLIVPGSDRR